MVAFTRWFVADTTEALDEALTTIAAAAKVGHQPGRDDRPSRRLLLPPRLLDWPTAWGHAEAALTLAQHLGARRFEAEALAFRRSSTGSAGRRAEALATSSEALTISRETGMAFIGPVILGILALAADDPAVRDDGPGGG